MQAFTIISIPKPNIIIKSLSFSYPIKNLKTFQNTPPKQIFIIATDTKSHSLAWLNLNSIRSQTFENSKIAAAYAYIQILDSSTHPKSIITCFFSHTLWKATLELQKTAISTSLDLDGQKFCKRERRCTRSPTFSVIKLSRILDLPCLPFIRMSWARIG